MNEWEDYTFWLLDHVGFRIKGYDYLMSILNDTDYIWVLDRDENRADDGLRLRDEYGLYFDRPCSVLEMLVGLAIRINNDYIGDPLDEHPEIIFWEMICNLHLDRFNDDHMDSDLVSRILNNWMNRRFSTTGSGSIFPQYSTTNRDQRKIEIWAQMVEYISRQGA